MLPLLCLLLFVCVSWCMGLPYSALSVADLLLILLVHLLLRFVFQVMVDSFW
jgi:hypothetical protein